MNSATQKNNFFNVHRVLISALAVGAILATVYSVQAVLSRDSTGYDLIPFLTGFGAAAAVVLGYWYWLVRMDYELNFYVVLIWACVFRLIGIWGEPILEDDYFRYLLDACLFVTYGSPYGIAPESLFVTNALTPACNAMLTGVNNPQLATIYAPFLQYIFVVSHLLSPVNLDLLQFIITLFDLAVILLLGKLAPARTVMLYAWCPLVIKEFAFTAHPDVIGVSLLLAAFFVRSRGSMALGCILVAAAVCTKVIAAVALPFFLFRQPFRYWILVLGAILTLYLPFLLQHQQTDLATLAHFAANWQFNAPVFGTLKKLLSDQSTRYLCLAVFLVWYGFYFRRYFAVNRAHEIPRMDWVFGVFLLVSPVLNAWYWVWVLPFAVIWPSAWAWTASVTLALSYVIGLHLPESDLNDYQVANFALIAQVLSIGIALFYDWRHKRLTLSRSD